MRVLRGLILPALLLLAWEFLLAPSDDMIPPPSTLAAVMFRFYGSEEFLTSLAASVLRVAAGYALGVGLGVALGTAIGLSRNASQLLEPLTSMLRPIAPIAWTPLAIIWFGLSERATIFLIAYAVMFPILTNTIAGVQGVARAYIDAARTLGAVRWSIIREVIVPAALPAILTGLRVGLGLSWAVIVAAELIIGYTLQLGLGYILVRYSQVVFNVPRVIAVILALGALGFLTDLALRFFERRLVPWKLATQLR